MIQAKRIYDEPKKTDGFRILVDRLWPRGVSKEDAKVDLWLKEISPSNKLRKWFSHDSKKWSAFKKKYKAELKTTTESLNKIKQIETKATIVTLLYAAKDEEHNNAIALIEILK